MWDGWMFMGGDSLPRPIQDTNDVCLHHILFWHQSIVRPEYISGVRSSAAVTRTLYKDTDYAWGVGGMFLCL